MAVQAQYPSNVLLLNRNGQEGKNTLGSDYSLQPQPGGFLNQSHLFFNNGVNANMRKRGREAIGDGEASEATVPTNLFSLQSHPTPTALVSLAQLHNQQPNIVSTGLHLAFEQQQQQKQSFILPSSTLSSFLSEDFESQIKQQRDEIDQFLQNQGEQLRHTLAEKRQRDYCTLLGAAEESAAQRLREKAAEIAKATRRNEELQKRVAQLSVEAHVWQAKTRAQEGTAASLQAQIQKIMVMMGAQDKMEEGTGQTYAEDAESAHIDPERVVSLSSSTSKAWPSCKACRIRAASIVVLPCRHLCICRECDADVAACPLCLSFRSGSVEVYFS